MKHQNDKNGQNSSFEISVSISNTIPSKTPHIVFQIRQKRLEKNGDHFE